MSAATQINLEGWQDFRGDHAGVLMYVETSKQSVAPIRDQLNEQGKGNLYEPNYETRTYGLRSSQNSRAVSSIIKNKHRYVLFGTRYDGVEEEFKGQFLIFGYMRIDKVKDVRTRHIHNYMRDMESQKEPDCMTLSEAFALYSEDMKFFMPADCFNLSSEQMQTWGYKGRVTKQMKLLLEAEKLDDVLNHFSDKEDASDEYITTVKEFISALEDEDDDDEEEGDAW